MTDNSHRLKIGVLALQGAFQEHVEMLEALGVDTVRVRYADQLRMIDGLVIPGGESTTIAKLTSSGDEIFEGIRSRAEGGMPVFGTCMGSIFLARGIEGSEQGRLALADIAVRRNAFGPQRHSFEAELEIAALGTEPFNAVFIRAPLIVSVGKNVQVLATIDSTFVPGEAAAHIVLARQENLLVSVFHPELTNDSRVHQYFVNMVEAYCAKDRNDSTATKSLTKSQSTMMSKTISKTMSKTIEEWPTPELSSARI